MKRTYKQKQKKEYLYEISREPPMRLPARIHIDDFNLSLLLKGKKKKDFQWDALEQLQRVAMLPGIESYAFGMADIHPGYGFPIGGVARFNLEEGLLCVVGGGFDCNCGVRALRIPLFRKEIINNKDLVANELASIIPVGLGKKSRFSFAPGELDKILPSGVPWLVKQGFGLEEDMVYTENNGFIKNADPRKVSELAKKRQSQEMGSLGSGNHYLEILFVDKILNRVIAQKWNLNEESVLALIHSGSRALGHQVGIDYIRSFRKALPRYSLDLPHMDLIGMPFSSLEGQNYLQAMNAAMNCAYANRQLLTCLVREVFTGIFHIPGNRISTLYDVGHNKAWLEKHKVNGKEKKLIVHRKGSTCSLPPKDPLLPEQYSSTGQPVLVSGSMGTHSYLLAGTTQSNKTIFSTIHGTGRLLSRREAKNNPSADNIWKTLAEKQIILKAASKKGVTEEIPEAY